MDRDVVANVLGAAAMRLLEQRLIKTYVVPDPAIGQTWSVKVPGGVTWELLHVYTQLTTSAVAGNRNLKLQCGTQDNVEFARYTGPNTQAASSVIPYTFDAGIGEVSSGAAFNASLPNPPLVMVTGEILTVFVTAMDVGDQFNLTQLRVREWSESDVLQELRAISNQLASQVMPEIIS